jgi:hypothetical protein
VNGFVGRDAAFIPPNINQLNLNREKSKSKFLLDFNWCSNLCFVGRDAVFIPPNINQLNLNREKSKSKFLLVLKPEMSGVRASARHNL